MTASKNKPLPERFALRKRVLETRDKDIKMREKVLLTVLIDFMSGDETTAFPGQDKIAANMGVSIPTVKRSLALLKKAGVLSVGKRPTSAGFVNLYALNTEWVGSPVDPTIADCEGKVGSPVDPTLPEGGINLEEGGINSGGGVGSPGDPGLHHDFTIMNSPTENTGAPMVAGFGDDDVTMDFPALTTGDTLATDDVVDDGRAPAHRGTPGKPGNPGRPRDVEGALVRLLADAGLEQDVVQQVCQDPKPTYAAYKALTAHLGKAAGPALDDLAKLMVPGVAHSTPEPADDPLGIPAWLKRPTSKELREALAS